MDLWHHRVRVQPFTPKAKLQALVPAATAADKVEVGEAVLLSHSGPGAFPPAALIGDDKRTPHGAGDKDWLRHPDKVPVDGNLVYGIVEAGVIGLELEGGAGSSEVIPAVRKELLARLEHCLAALAGCEIGLVKGNRI
jgi:hypothetical protein